MKKEPVSLDVVTLDDDGYGVSADGRHGVFGSLPGEFVTSIPITRRNKKLFGRASTIANPAADRVEARCSAAGVRSTARSNMV